MAGWEWPLRYTFAAGTFTVNALWLAGNGHFDTLRALASGSLLRLWLAGNGHFDTLLKYGLSVCTQLWLAGNGHFDTLYGQHHLSRWGYGWLGMATSIHFRTSSVSCGTAMAGWEWPLRYTAASRTSAARAAMAGWEWPLRYTVGSVALASPAAMAGWEWPLRYTPGSLRHRGRGAMAGWEWPLRYTCRIYRPRAAWLWLAGNGHFDTLVRRVRFRHRGYGWLGMATSIH